jgi:hypothetical protein
MALKDLLVDLSNATIGKMVRDLPDISAPVLNITHLLDLNTNDDITAYLYRSNSDDKRDIINIHGFNSDGTTDDIVITPILGFGPHYNQKLPASYVDSNNTVQTNIIELKLDNGITNGQIKIPGAVNSFDLTYFRTKDGSSVKPGYYRYNNYMQRFELENTPIVNWQSSNTYVTIGGQTREKAYMTEIYFGDSYNSVKTVNYFLAGYFNLEKVDLSGLKNVTNFGGNFMNNGSNTSKLKELDLSVINEITSVSLYFCTKMSSLEKLNISTMTLSEYNYVYYFFSNCPELNDVNIGSIDWSNYSISGQNFYQNRNSSECILRADSLAIANKWKQTFPQFSEWSIIINPN